ncbi:MAG: hypothetical protein COS99_01440 [Candidatus Omnitrophica bacterium CG07_land_8_20_14_0_80_42_15]|uniref:DUF3568 domain-containing protein n=1 Tax=Candidatus Aquitaenariimonas noxiae TaxID=1974741 RepID=A0A2J0L272_9BACT|nr:MAG: hypothetical protein COS99_01440 [Candidatus Omnitrophica bacterium CG07_land_8_20_14_0_80_42_15]
MRLFYIIAVIVLTFPVSGCGMLIDWTREGAGYPAMELMSARKDALKQSFDISYDQGFERALNTLDQMKATVYAKNKKERYIVAMKIKGCIDTTEVGIFFSEESPNKLSVEIFSKSPKAKNIVSIKIFSELAEGK